MSNDTVHIISGHILEESSPLSLRDLCKNTHMPAELMIRMVEHGIISPIEGTSARQWRFHSQTLVRVDKALRIKQDLGVNLAGTALVLDLLDEIKLLKTALHTKL